MPWQPELAGRTGWLIPVALGVTLSPFHSLFAISTVSRSFTETGWAALNALDADTSGLVSVVTIEMLFDIFILLGSVQIALLFWTKHRSFPLLGFTVMLASAFAHVLDNWAALEMLHVERRLPGRWF